MAGNDAESVQGSSSDDDKPALVPGGARNRKRIESGSEQETVSPVSNPRFLEGFPRYVPNEVRM
jgi:hypothetical protein